MPGSEGDNASLDAAAEQRHVADEVEQFVARGLVLVVERREVAEFGGVKMGLPEFVGHVVESLLRHGCLVDDERVLQVAAFDEPHSQERLYLAYKAESARCGYLAGVVGQVAQLGMLLAEESGGVGDGNFCLEMVAGEQHHLIAVFRLIFNRFRYYEHLLLGVLLL